MEWEGRQESTNVEDRRGLAPAGLAVGGGGILLVIVALLFGVDPRQLRGPGGPGGQVAQNNGPADPREEKQARFAKVIFGDTERVWDEQFGKMGKRYPKPTLVLFSGQVDSACGTADSAVGPFYCPGDSKVYIDLSFFHEMETRFKEGGEFARAYVIAHEVGHHVQRLLGYSTRGGRDAPNQMSVRLELQADYFAGVWAHYGQQKYHFIQPGDIESALHAAKQIGDDTLQKQARGRVMPDKFTHGTSAQRTRWFKAGFDSGDIPGAKRLFDLRYEEL